MMPALAEPVAHGSRTGLLVGGASELAERCAVRTSHQICEDGRIDVFGEKPDAAVSQDELSTSVVPAAETSSD